MTRTLSAPDIAEQKAIAPRMQEQAFVDVPYIPFGQVLVPTVHRASGLGMRNRAAV